MLKSRDVCSRLVSVFNYEKYSQKYLFNNSMISSRRYHFFCRLHYSNKHKRNILCDTLCTSKYSYLVAFNRTQSTLTSNLSEEKLDRYLRNININTLHLNFNLNKNQNNIVLKLLEEKHKLVENLKQLESMKESEGHTKDGNGMLELINEDVRQYTVQLKEINEKIIDCLIPKSNFEDCNDIVLEISAGVGGLEAMLFASELQNMYCGLLDYKGWQYFFAENDESESGGVRHSSLLVSGPGAYRILQHEAGVHRVQRVPATERSGRIHTSTVTVAVLPQPSEVEVNLKESDLKIETKRASGAGGQHVNTTESAVRVVHIPTGIAVECQAGRSQVQNKITALKRLQAKIYERELNQIDSNTRAQRKTQVGTSSRSEKIRTYNFRDDRISDHRIQINVHNLREFLKGGERLDKLLIQLDRWHRDCQVQQFIESLPS